MSDLILVLSKCQRKIRKVKEQKNYFRFHFKGFYLGHKVREILIIDGESEEYEIDQDYLLFVKKHSIEDGILKVITIKSKRVGT